MDNNTIKEKITFANSLYSQAKYEEAIQIYKDLLTITDESLKYERCELHRKLGDSYYKLNDYDNAILDYENSLNYFTNNESVYNMLGFLYFYKDIDKSINYYLKGMELKPNLKNFVMLTQVMTKNKQFSQKDLKEIFEKYVDALRPEIMGENKAFVYEKPYNHKKLRIGYLSSDFHCHTMMSFVLPILENHDHKKFDIYLYSCGKKEDSVTNRIKATGATFKVCRDLDNYELAKEIHEDEIDILIDISGYTHNAIWSLLYKPAPVICQYLGFLGTYGIKEVDYILADKFTIPESIAKHYTEKPLYINCGMNRFTFNTVNQKLPEITPLPYLTNNYITFGSFSCMSKINPYTVSLWAKVLHAIPTSKLLIYRTSMQERDIVRLKRQFADNGIDENRLIFENKQMPINHFQSYLMADVALDPTPFGGLSLTIEQAFMGIPTLTLVGETISGTGTARVNKTIGLDNFIATSEDDFVQRAVELASNPMWLKEYRTYLRQTMYNNLLFTDHKKYVIEIEKAYTKAWKKYANANKKILWFN